MCSGYRVIIVVHCNNFPLKAHLRSNLHIKFGSRSKVINGKHRVAPFDPAGFIGNHIDSALLCPGNYIDQGLGLTVGNDDNIAILFNQILNICCLLCRCTVCICCNHLMPAIFGIGNQGLIYILIMLIGCGIDADSNFKLSCFCFC